MRREHAAKKKLLTQEKAGIEKREDVIQAKEYLSNNYLTRLDEITNMLRSAGDGSDDAVSSLSKDEIKELRQEYKELHQEYRQQHTKLSTRNNVLQTLEEDIYFLKLDRTRKTKLPGFPEKEVKMSPLVIVSGV